MLERFIFGRMKKSTIPGDPQLNYRVPLYELDAKNRLGNAEKPSLSIVVNSDIVQLFNTSQDSSHVLFCKIQEVSHLRETSVGNQISQM